MLITCPYFDNLKFEIIDAGGPQCHILSHLYCISVCPLTPWCKTFYYFSDFYPCSNGTKLVYEITLTE